MARLLKTILFAVTLFTGFAAQADQYKCYVAGADGENHIVFNEAGNMGKARELAKDQKVLVGVPRPVAVSRVFECAKLADRFLDAKANALDAATPR